MLLQAAAVSFPFSHYSGMKTNVFIVKLLQTAKNKFRIPNLIRFHP